MKYNINYFKNKGIDVYNKMPLGWRKVVSTHTQPNGTIWICNNESLFSDKYKHALLIIDILEV